MREHKGKSIIALPSDFVVIDTETTGLDYDLCHLIEVSALKYANGVCVDAFTTLIQPPLTEAYSFGEDGEMEIAKHYVDEFISELTGITNEMLADAPELESVLPDFLDFIGDSILIGHNVNFDINFLYDAAMDVCQRPVQNDYIDTLRVARKVFPNLQHHRLSDVAQACGIAAEGAHRAEDDCRTTAACYEAMRSLILTSTTEDAFVDLFKYRYEKGLATIQATTDEIDPTNPIYGKVVVFTGTLSSMPRKDAFQIVANLGGIPENSINAQTNYLVIGNAEFVKSVKEGKTNKMKKAESMIQKGFEISVISEAAFFDLISGQ